MRRNCLPDSACLGEKSSLLPGYSEVIAFNAYLAAIGSAKSIPTVLYPAST